MKVTVLKYLFAVSIGLALLSACGLSDEERQRLDAQFVKKRESDISKYLSSANNYYKAGKYFSAKYAAIQAKNFGVTKYSDTLNAIIASVDSMQADFNRRFPDYKIVTTNHYPKCQNFHIKFTAKSKALISKFLKEYASLYCPEQFTIMIYKNESARDLMTKYPLTREEYRRLAKTTTAMLVWEDEEVWFDPYKDAFN